MQRQTNIILCLGKFLQSIKGKLSSKKSWPAIIGPVCSTHADKWSKLHPINKEFIKVQQRYNSTYFVKENANLCQTDANHTKNVPLQISSAILEDYLNIEEVVSILNESMCEDLCVIKVDFNKTRFHYVDYFVVTSGRSVRHLKSMAFLLCSKVNCKQLFFYKVYNAELIRYYPFRFCKKLSIDYKHLNFQ